MCEQHNYTAPDRQSTTFIDLQVNLSQSPEADRDGNIGEALSQHERPTSVQLVLEYDGPAAAQQANHSSRKRGCDS